MCEGSLASWHLKAVGTKPWRVKAMVAAGTKPLSVQSLHSLMAQPTRPHTHLLMVAGSGLNK